ncbi:MAG: hypothetical protein OEY19_11075, partial [Gammaproteobacteria bacterium]|nr:hypothetical protein [Gammaproteobacteria bacterium]
IEQSERAYLLKPNGMKPIESVRQIKSDLLYWPDWRSRPWIVAGTSKESPSEIVFSGLFIKDCTGDGFNNQVASLLKHFDWAIFSYFTTYQSDICCLVTSCTGLIKNNVVNTYGAEAEISIFEGDPISSLRTATFYDYELEGYFAYEVAKANGEKPPLLFCRIDIENPDLYRKWNNETDEHDPDLWYENHLDKLNLVEEFTTEYQGYKFKNLIYQVSNERAYIDIWSEASEDHSIAEATFSANTNLKKLKSALTKSYSFEITKDLDDYSEWAYSQIYGGGADEHHAIFRSKDPKITQKLWELVGKNQISRF